MLTATLALGTVAALVALCVVLTGRVGPGPSDGPLGLWGRA